MKRSWHGLGEKKEKVVTHYVLIKMPSIKQKQNNDKIINNFKSFATVFQPAFAISCNNKPNDKEIQDSVTKQLRINNSLTIRTSVQDIVSKYPGVQADVTSGGVVK